MRRVFLISVLLALFTPFVSAQTVHKYLIEAGKLYDSEQGTFLPDMVILVDGNIIASVINMKSISENDKKNREVIDLRNYTVLPGLIDTHTHLLSRELVSPNNNFPSLDMVRTLTLDGDAYRALYGAAKAKAYLEAGITTVQDLGNSGMFADLALKRAINEGLLPGPRMVCSGPGLAAEGGQAKGLNFTNAGLATQEYRIIKSVEDGIQAVRENINQGAAVIKIYAENSPNKTSLSIAEMTAIVNEAHRYGVRVTAHATSNKAAYNAVISGVDGIDHGYHMADSTLKLMAKKGTFLIPTDADTSFLQLYARVAYPGNKEIEAMILKQTPELGVRLRRAIEFGVNIAAGSDDYVDLGQPFAMFSKKTLLCYSQEGMSVHQILAAATINAAKHVNQNNRLGRISKGYYADVIAVDKNMDKDIRAIMNVHFVMKDGKVVVSPWQR